MSKRSSPEVVIRYTTIPFIIDALTRRELHLLDYRSWDDRNDSLFMSLYKQYREVNQVYAACCTLSLETYHHWRAFGGSASGAYIEFDKRGLEAHLKTLKAQGHALRFSKVRYYTLEKIEDRKTKVYSYPFVKRWGFQAEKEYRIIAESNDDAATYSLPIPLSIINRVVISPWLPKETYESVRDLLRRIEGCTNLRVSKSQLIDSTRWRAAGIKTLAGRLRTRQKKS